MIFSVNGPSGGKLAYLLDCSVVHPGGQDRNYTWGLDKTREYKLPRPINYGCKKAKISLDCVNYNSEDVCDKIHSFKMFDLCDVPHPQLINPETHNGKYLGRKNGLSKGKGIELFEGKRKFDNDKFDFFVEFLDSHSEYRVHVWEGQIVCEMEKEFGKHDFIQSSVYGANLRARYIKHPKRLEILNLAVEAIRCMDLDYGAVDILITKDQKPYVLEVNSAPSFSGVIGYLYAEYIMQRWSLRRKKNWSIKHQKVEKTPKSFYYYKENKQNE